MDFNKLRVNCNRLHRIFAHNADCITEKEEKRLQELLLKDRLSSLTEKESERLEVLQDKKDESDPHIVSRSAQMYLLFRYFIVKYGKFPNLFTHGYINPSAANGVLKEPYSIELISRISGIKLYRNKQTIKSEYLTGVIDAWDSPDWQESKLVHEIKTTSNACKFLLRKRYPLTKLNILQAQGYMALTDKDTCHIHFCLVDFPESTISEQHDELFSYLCPDRIVTDKFTEEWTAMENRLRFSNIPDKDRIFTCKVERDEEIIGKIYKKIMDCRKWLNDFVEFNETADKHKFVSPNKVRI